jgi:hypothetical protein
MTINVFLLPFAYNGIFHSLSECDNTFFSIPMSHCRTYDPARSSQSCMAPTYLVYILSKISSLSVQPPGSVDLEVITLRYVPLFRVIRRTVQAQRRPSHVPGQPICGRAVGCYQHACDAGVAGG